MSARFVLGIDLGTTNCVLAYASLEADQPHVHLVSVPQLVDRGTTEGRTVLPAFLYLAGPHDAAGGSLDLPWSSDRSFAVGEFARRQTADAPQWTVGAAKSWLCHSRVDRRQPILPWNAPDGVPKVSPVAAARHYLEHLVAAWEHAHPEAPVGLQRVVLTVPASFDAAARELTREAALAAGLPQDLILLEEPQAAVYAWLAVQGDRWRRLLHVGDRLLVCDVGGGTTDLTLIGVTEIDGELALQRLAVGDHLLVGGDNMDLALAHLVARRFAEQGVKLDPWQTVSLWHSCRNAKEAMLAPGGPDTYAISILGRGSKLIGGTVSAELDRTSVVRELTDGFFPRCGFGERPRRQAVSGFREIGLPYESDTAVTRHVAAFLRSHGGEGSSALPTRVLFNGGVFKAEVLRQRLLDVVGGWGTDGARPELLDGEHDLDHAVSLGAAHYGWTKERGGVRIRGGVARSYYVGIETAGLAVPGAPRPLRALCVVPFGMEEGTERDVPSADIGLVLGEPANFRFFSSAVRKEDQPGHVLESWSDQELVETDSLETTLPAEETTDEPYVPVRFQSRITELGTFELWCVGTQSVGRWKLEFSVRQED
ncbi:MAG: Hsp70 family protein [Planctomycetes bacterium]|nr:Hsp70 family protein [Planctomycetota bacterium]